MYALYRVAFQFQNRSPNPAMHSIVVIRESGLTIIELELEREVYTDQGGCDCARKALIMRTLCVCEMHRAET